MSIYFFEIMLVLSASLLLQDVRKKILIYNIIYFLLV